MSQDNNFKANVVEGISKFQSARLQAFWTEMLSHLRGKPAELLSFDEVRQKLRLNNESYRGLHNIELKKIVGSVGRYKEFTRSFLPKNPQMQERWSRVYAKIQSMEGVPPIEVYKVGEVYFVRDGNHRVSVAVQLGFDTIEAHVTELLSPIAFRADMTLEQLDHAEAYAEFIKLTDLAIVRPHHQSLQLSKPTRYNDLIGHIELHKAFVEHTFRAEVSFREAAAHWYDSVYRPALTLIRKYGILALVGKGEHDMPHTEADMYLWMVDHLREIEAQMEDRETLAYTFSDTLVDFLTQKKLSIPKSLLIEEDEPIIVTEQQLEQVLKVEEHTIPPAFSGYNAYLIPA
jgi:hypothetical protein